MALNLFRILCQMLHEIAFFILAKAQFEMVRLNSILVSHGDCAEKREKIRKKSKIRIRNIMACSHVFNG